VRKNSSATLDDVAKLAKVSRATVSRVINTPEKVSPEICERTLAAIAKLRYTPNFSARALTTGTPLTIGLVFFEDIRTLFANPFWGEILNPVYENLAKRNLSCNLIAHGSFAKNENIDELYGQFIAQGRADGYIFFGRYPEEIEKRFGLAHLPIVIFGKPYSNNSEFSFVDTDNITGASSAVAYLASRGRKRIATITGPVDGGAGFDRFLGYKNGLVEVGMKFDPSLVAYGEWTRESGIEAMKKLLKDNKDIDGIFIASDLMAVGALEVLADHKIKVPKDIAIVANDNSELAVMSSPTLTSVKQPCEEIGSELVVAVLKAIEGVSHQARILGTEIIERESA
jgi:LacI family transcriptional regulator